MRLSPAAPGDPLNTGRTSPSCGWTPHVRGTLVLTLVIFPAGPTDAEDLARVHVASWRETYRGLLSDAFLARMSEPGFTRGFRRDLADPKASVTLAAADRYGLVGYAQGGPSRRRVAGEAEIATLYV